MCHAFIVFANPDAAFTSSGVSPVAAGSAARYVLIVRIAD
jgi:hypothetical protein